MKHSLQYIIFLVLLCMALTGCDRFVTYKLIVTGLDDRRIDKVEITDVKNKSVEYTDSEGYAELTKITGGIKPDLSKQVILRKEGFADTLIELIPDSQMIIKLTKK